MDFVKELRHFVANTSEGIRNTILLPNVVLIIISIIITAFLKLLTLILEPMNYELDMTTRDFCKTIAEVNNNWIQSDGSAEQPQRQRSTNKSAPVEQQQQQTASDCATSSSESSAPTSSADGSDPFQTGPSPAENNPPPKQVYPNGWIPVIESMSVEPGTVKKAIILGRDVIVTRSSDGKQVNVLDAYCPHMGVHIGIGGKVREVNNDSCVECPFHGWTFRASNGQCVKIPYQKKCSIPKQAKLGTWHSVEVDNFIYIWHHADGLPPSWHFEPSDLLERSDWHLAGRSCHLTNMDLRNMLENGADMNHFEGIHNDLFLFGGKITELAPLKWLQDYVRHHWLPEWKPTLDKAGKMTHKAEMKLQSWISVLKFRVFDITVNALQIGPARVNLNYDSRWYGKGLLIMNAVPLGGRRTKYVQHIYTERTLFQTFMAKWVLYGEIRQLERDFFIWNHQKDVTNPILVPEDKTLKQFRMWYSQFHKRRQRIVIRDPEAEDRSLANGSARRNNLEF